VVGVSYTLDVATDIDFLCEPITHVAAQVTSEGSGIQSDMFFLPGSVPYNRALTARASLLRQGRMLLGSIPRMSPRLLYNELRRGYDYRIAAILTKGESRG
jgi:hypothetical protein